MIKSKQIDKPIVKRTKYTFSSNQIGYGCGVGISVQAMILNFSNGTLDGKTLLTSTTDKQTKIGIHAIEWDKIGLPSTLSWNYNETSTFYLFNSDDEIIYWNDDGYLMPVRAHLVEETDSTHNVILILHSYDKDGNLICLGESGTSYDNFTNIINLDTTIEERCYFYYYENVLLKDENPTQDYNRQEIDRVKNLEQLKHYHIKETNENGTKNEWMDMSSYSFNIISFSANYGTGAGGISGWNYFPGGGTGTETLTIRYTSTSDIPGNFSNTSFKLVKETNGYYDITSFDDQGTYIELTFSFYTDGVTLLSFDFSKIWQTTFGESVSIGSSFSNSLSFYPKDKDDVSLIVNGVDLINNLHFTVDGKTVSLTNNAPYDIEITDIIEYKYETTYKN